MSHRLNPLTPALAGESLTIDDLSQQAEHALTMLGAIKKSMLSPLGKKSPPRYTAPQVQSMLGIQRQAFDSRVKSGRFPEGEVKESVTGGRKRRTYGVDDVRAMRRTEGNAFRKPGDRAFVLAATNLKGGVGKTTLGVSIAEGMALHGADVLVLDLDPQGTATTLLGLIPDADVGEADTFLACIPGAFPQPLQYIDTLIQKTYWPGVDLVPAAITLSEADLHLPTMSERDKAAKFYAVLDDALVNARQHYDVIVIDIPPSLSYLTHNAIYSANGLLIPLPPNYLDYASVASFWRVFADLAKYISEHSGRPSTYEYDFARVVMNKVRAPNHPITIQVMDWIRATYGAKVTPNSIPYTAMTERAAVLSMGTLYDMDSTGGAARLAFDALLAEVMTLIQRAWARRAAAETSAAALENAA